MRRLLVSEVPLQKRAPALLGPGVIGDRSEPAFTFVTKCLELRHEITGASAKDRGRYPDDDAARVITLNEPGLLEIRQQHLGDP